MDKRGENILTGNVIFIVLNLMFFLILTLFIFRQGAGAVLLEENYAKEIALLIDSAKPGMEIILDMEDGFELAEKNGISKKDIVRIEDNIIFVKLSEKSGYSYSFFKDVSVNANPVTHDENGTPVSTTQYKIEVYEK